jgi:hypothetical protein
MEPKGGNVSIPLIASVYAAFRVGCAPSESETNMSIHKPYVTIVLTFIGALALPWTAFASDLSEVKLPGDRAYPESITAAPDGTLYVGSPAVGGVWRIKPQTGEQPPQGAPGLDGIAFGGDGSLYVNTFAKGDFFRVDVKDGLPGKITKLKPSRPLKLPDGLRSTGGQTFVMAEGGGSVDRVTVNGDDVEIATIKDGIAGPTSVVPVGQTLWVSEGQLPHLFEAAKSGPPHLPFRVIGLPMNK